MNDVDVVVIGAGQFGRYYDSLTLFSPARFCELPGLRMPGDRSRYPSRDEAVAYLRRYAEHLELPICTRARVVAVRAVRVGLWEVELATGETLCTRGAVPLRRQRPLGIDLHYWVAWSGLDRLPLGRRAGSSVGVLDEGRYAAAIAAGKPDRREMFFGLTPDGVEWWEGPRERVDTVILATGYRPALGYLPTEAFAEDAWPVHRRGVSTTLPRLGYVGLPGQTGLASATLRGVGPDARHVVRQIRQQLDTPAPATLERPLAEAMS